MGKGYGPKWTDVIKRDRMKSLEIFQYQITQYITLYWTV